MKIQLLIASDDADYVEHLSGVLLERYADMFEVSICSERERFRELNEKGRMDAVLMCPAMAQGAELEHIRLPLLLWEGERLPTEEGDRLHKIRKYQRISTMVAEILGEYAQISCQDRGEDNQGNITAVWSPAGGTGKTTVALAYAAQKASQGKQIVYLDLDFFSSTKAFFQTEGKSISSAFGRLDSDVSLLMKSIRQQDSKSGIYYFECPDNYDDLNVLTEEDMIRLVLGCAHGVDEVVVDLPSACDARIRALLTQANQVLVVLDGSRTAWEKWNQFRRQNNVYEEIRQTLVLVANKNALWKDAGEERQVRLPAISSDDPVLVYQTLSANHFFLD